MTIDAPGFEVIHCSVLVAESATEVWQEIGGFADAGRFLELSCTLASGDGALGSVRDVGGVILEVMVGASATSYAYVQTRGPMAPFSYHGNVTVDPVGPRTSRLVYTVLYDPASMDAVRRESERVRIRNRFQGAIEAMKRAVEAQ